MKSLILAAPVQQVPPPNHSVVMALGAALVLIFAVRLLARSLQPFHELLKAAASMGLAMLLMIAALLLVVVSVLA